MSASSVNPDWWSWWAALSGLKVDDNLWAPDSLTFPWSTCYNWALALCGLEETVLLLGVTDDHTNAQVLILSFCFSRRVQSIQRKVHEMSQREQLWQLHVPTAVQRLPGVPNGPVRMPVKMLPSESTKVTCIIVLVLFFVFSQLMTKEPLEKLGFKDLMDPPPSQAGKDNKAWFDSTSAVSKVQKHRKKCCDRELTRMTAKTLNMQLLCVWDCVLSVNTN